MSFRHYFTTVVASFVVAAGGLIFWSLPVSARTIYADGDLLISGQGTEQDPVNTYRAALSLLIPSEQNTIYATGTFAEGVDLSAPQGGQSDETRTVIDQWPDRPMPINDVTNGDDNGKDVYLAFYLHDTAYVTIRNQKAVGSKATNFWSQKSQFIVFENNITSKANEKGICVYDSQDVVVRGNVAFDNGLIGIYMPMTAERIVAEDNIAYGNGEHGILSGSGSRDITVRNNLVYNNNWKNVVGGGNIAGRGASGEARFTIEGNTIWGGNGGVVFNAWSDVTITDNVISDMPSDGISLRGTVNATIGRNIVTAGDNGIAVTDAQNVVIDANTVKDAKKNGISLMGGSLIRVQNNVLVRNTNTGVNVIDPVKVKLINNTIVDHPTGLFVQSPMNPQPNVKIENNIFADNITVARLNVQDVSNISSDFNAFSGYQSFAFVDGVRRTFDEACRDGKECHSFNNADPQFVDPATDDYHLQATSPLIGQGRVRGTPDFDVDGEDRARDGKVDIGADEVMVVSDQENFVRLKLITMVAGRLA